MTDSARHELAAGYLASLGRVLKDIRAHELDAFLDALEQAYQRDGQVFVAGNGGSAATASHMACDLGKNTCLSAGPVAARPLRVVSLTDNIALISALANDCGYENIYAGQLSALVRTGDLLIAVSASGNSPNILAAIRVARSRGAVTVGLLGNEGGQAASLVDTAVIVRSADYGLIEDAHLAVNHIATLWMRHVIRRPSAAAADG